MQAQSGTSVGQNVDRFMWAGTSFGVVRLDLTTRAYTFDNQPGSVLRLFLITIADMRRQLTQAH